MSASVFPAPAGMSRMFRAPSGLRERFPRTCGDEPKRVIDVVRVDEFSPHLRG